MSLDRLGMKVSIRPYIAFSGKSVCRILEEIFKLLPCFIRRFTYPCRDSPSLWH